MAESKLDISNSPPLVQQPPPASERLASLANLFAKATSEQRQMLRDALGVKEGTIRKKKSKVNSNARMFVSQFGECVHTEDFKPMPSEAVWSKGPAAVEAWRERWESQESSGLSTRDLEEIAAAATE